MNAEMDDGRMVIERFLLVCIHEKLLYWKMLSVGWLSVNKGRSEFDEKTQSKGERIIKTVICKFLINRSRFMIFDYSAKQHRHGFHSNNIGPDTHQYLQ